MHDIAMYDIAMYDITSRNSLHQQHSASSQAEKWGHGEKAPSSLLAITLTAMILLKLTIFIIHHCLCYIICIHFCKFQQHGTKRQEVGTVKGVVWEEERLPIQHIFYSNRILLAIITMQGMISHTMYSQWCLK